MKYLFIVLSALVFNSSIEQGVSITHLSNLSPLSAYSTEWNKAAYSTCNTAKNVDYMNDVEKEVIYILNLARAYPKLFANTVLAKYPAMSGKERLINNEYYYQSLIKKMLTMEQAPIINPDEKCFTSAACHAKTSGEEGYVGHIRTSNECKVQQHFLGECCDYGNKEPLNIILSLLIDEDIPSFGHRKILLGNYSLVGVSMQPHKTYRQNTVLDFYR
ncbi:MAG: hypothetical protein ABIQ31_22360 [Ferruginibacter sp.]